MSRHDARSRRNLLFPPARVAAVHTPGGGGPARQSACRTVHGDQSACSTQLRQVTSVRLCDGGVASPHRRARIVATRLDARRVGVPPGSVSFGAHWARVEIGWGGFYAWDPVECSADAWLAATAFPR
jgi:hypothetical protein